MKKVLLVLIVSAFSFFGYKFFTQSVQGEDKELVFYGNVDTRVVTLGARFLGEIRELLKDEGQMVKKGDTLAVLDDVYVQNQIKSLKAKIKLENIKLEKLENGSRKEEIAQEKANLDLAKSNYQKAKDIFKRQERLYRSKTTSQEAYTNAKNTLDAAKAGVSVAKARYELVLNGSRYEDIKAQKELINLLEISLEKAKIDLQKTLILSPSDGVVLKRFKEVGSLVNPSEAIFEIAKVKEFWVRAYVDGASLGKIKPNQEMLIFTDIKKEPYLGKVGFISSMAEFTPKNVQTQKLRSDLVYKFRVFIIDADEKIKQGLPVHLKIKDDKSS